MNHSASGQARERAAAETYTCTLQVRWADFDQLNHVNNTKYVEYAQEARLLFFRDKLARASVSVPATVVRRLEIDFLRPLLPDSNTITVKVEVLKIGTTSVTMRQTIYDSSGEISCVVDAVIVVFDLDAARPLALEEAQRGVLSRYAVSTQDLHQ